MLARERQKIILDKINTEGIVYLSQLSEELKASICTIRRDFEKLESQNLCKRVHGGAIKVQNTDKQLSDDTDLHMNKRMTMNIEEKKKLCQKCAELIEDGDCVFIDGGTTFMYMNEYFRNKNIVVVTHNQLIKKDDQAIYKLYYLGGESSARYQMNLGPMTLDYMDYFHFDKAFISAVGLTLDDLNVYTAEIDTAKIKQAAMKHSKEKYLVIDSSKTGVAGFYTMANLNEFNTLVTTTKLEQLETDTNVIVCE